MTLVEIKTAVDAGNRVHWCIPRETCRQLRLSPSVRQAFEAVLATWDAETAGFAILFQFHR